MKNNRENDMALYVFSEEKLKEFKDMPVELRLKWLWEANAFLNRTLGIEKRAENDRRFEIFLKDKT